jgi:guanosine-3',5'-bis(diphosphate) 3'-pyrophosphohydrolase
MLTADAQEGSATNSKRAHRYCELLSRIRSVRPSDDSAILKKAYAFLLQYQGRLPSDQGQLVHPLEVATVVAEARRLDIRCITAALLHYALADIVVSADEIVQAFGDKVARLVDGLNKFNKIESAVHEQTRAEDLRKMLLAVVEDIRVVQIALAGRLHDMRMLRQMPRAQQLRIARQAQEVFAPIADLLGMGKIRDELAELALKYLDPSGFGKVLDAIEVTREKTEAFMATMQGFIEQKLQDGKIEARVEAGFKALYEIYGEKDSEDHLKDRFIRLRVITKSVNDCYAVLGIIHQLWPPVPGHIKDFIAMPGPNRYQSLHTAVISDDMRLLEVQIRTEEMHRLAEEGIASDDESTAAYWKNKAGPATADEEQRRAWLRNLLEWQRDSGDSNEFFSTLTVDLYPEQVYTSTPKGKVTILPRDATPIDFAYYIHTQVGHTCVGAKVNGRKVPLKYTLHSGDMVEILTQPGHKPKRAWLGLVKSSRARHKITRWLNAQRRKRAIELGHKLIRREARRCHLSVKEISDGALERAARSWGLERLEELITGVGYGRYSAAEVLAKVASGNVEPRIGASTPVGGSIRSIRPGAMGDGVSTIVVEGDNDLLVYRATCCNPIFGQDIVGYMTPRRGNRVAVHLRNCPNVTDLLYDPDRQRNVAWAPRSKGLSMFNRVRVDVSCDDRYGMLKEIATVFGETHADIHDISARTSNSQANVEIDFYVADFKHLERIVEGLRKIAGVHDVQRIK